MSALAKKITALFVLLALAACTVPAGKPVETVAADPALAQVRELLANAQLALSKDRLMKPSDDNAYYWYQQVLAIDELNREAHGGMRQVTRRYLQLAQQAFDSGRYERAQLMLDGAEKISAPPDQIKQLREKYQVPDAVENEFRLKLRDLNARNQAVISHLEKIAETARDNQSRLLIVARNDSEGRWLYRQMRSAVEGYRLRGNIEIGRLPRVVLIDL